MRKLDVFHLVFTVSLAVLCGFSLLFVIAAGTKLSELCAFPTPQNKCISANKTDGFRVACSGGFHGDFLADEYFLMQNLTLCHWPMDYFDPAVSLRPYPKLTKLTITKSKIKEIVGEFPEFMHNLKTLNLSHMNLERVEPSAFKHLLSLEVLDLSYNKLNHLYHPTTEYLPKLKQIWLGGQLWFCKNDLFWLLNITKDPLTFKVMDTNRMTCGGYKYIGKPVIPILRLLSDLEKECPSGDPNYCVCTLDNVVRGRSGAFNLHPLITVDCSYRDLKMLPKLLPHNTTALLVQGNQISTLDELLTNRYAKLLDIHLDYNRISSISILEGSRWLAQCRVMSIKGNNLTKVPTYALDYAFQRNRNIAQLYLGANPWRCDCLFAPAFQIHDLPRNTLCRNTSTDMVLVWDSLSVLLACMICIIILKFIYDYILYKKYGRLPWIITLLP